MEANMKIAVYDQDSYYAGKLCSIMSEKYGPEMEFVQMEKQEIADALENDFYSVYLLSRDAETLDRHEKAVGILCGSPEEVKEAGKTGILKYQNAVGIEKAIRACYDAWKIYNIDLDDMELPQIITFFSIGGGMGSSTVAKGAAEHYALQGAGVLYMNFKPFAPTGYFAEGGTTIAQLMKDIDGKEGELHQLISEVRKDDAGVAALKNDLTPELLEELDMRKFIGMISSVAHYKYVILDVQISTGAWLSDILKLADRICVVLDGSGPSLKRLMYARRYLAQIDESLEDKLKLIYNKFHAMPTVSPEIQKKVAGGIVYVESGTVQDVVQKVRNMKFLDTIVNG
jgi:hypothetical protein